jgi:hypothetical protein
LRASGIRGEVVVADNGSGDGSAAIAARHGARVVLAPMKGYGHALRRGIAEARGRFIVMGDADLSYDFGDVPRFVAKWREGWDVVMGNRFAGEIKPGAMPWHHRYLGNPLLSGLVRLLFHTDIGDSHCGLRAFTRDVYQRLDLRSTGMEFASELVVKAAMLGARMTEIPVTLWPDRRGRPPHLRSFRDGWRHLRFVLLYAPNWLFLFPGLSLCALGLPLVLWLLPGRRCLGGLCLDTHAMFFGVLLTLVGAQVAGIGLGAKIFAFTERFQAPSRGLLRWLDRLSLETGLLAGAVLALGGGGGVLWAVGAWAARGFATPLAVRPVLFWSLWLFLGVQVLFSSFFFSLLGVSRGGYVGDRDFRQEGD